MIPSQTPALPAEGQEKVEDVIERILRRHRHDLDRRPIGYSEVFNGELLALRAARDAHAKQPHNALPAEAAAWRSRNALVAALRDARDLIEAMFGPSDPCCVQASAAIAQAREV